MPPHSYQQMLGSIYEVQDGPFKGLLHFWRQSRLQHQQLQQLQQLQHQHRRLKENVVAFHQGSKQTQELGQTRVENEP